jgi:glyoxylase-like metal-dependent hydrolase (beta-lactamase superfamily II)/rhodanese-related sulfurtransferase
MVFHELNRGKCKTYLVACKHTRLAALIDPLKERVDRYLAFLAYHDLRLEWVIDTHTHVDHRTGMWDVRDLTGARGVMHRLAPAPHIDAHADDGQFLPLGHLELRFLHTPGHTPDSICIRVGGHLFTGDTLLIRGTGRSDFAGSDPGAQYDSITQKLFALPDATVVYPAHDYRGHLHSTIGEEKQANPRLVGRSRAEYIEIMTNLGLPLPDKIQESLQANQSAIEDDSMHFPSMAQLSQVRQISAPELYARLAEGAGSVGVGLSPAPATRPPVLIDVRESDEFRSELGHIPGSVLIPLKELAERAGELSPHRERDVVVICRAGVRSATGAAILTGLGFDHVWNLKGGMLDWVEARLPIER